MEEKILLLLFSTALTFSSTYGTSTETHMGPVAKQITEKLQELHPDYLKVINEGYKRNLPKEDENYLKVIIVSKSFDGVSLVDRHKVVHDALKEELQTIVHALTIEVKSLQEWNAKKAVTKAPDSSQEECN